jgi:hypothetical protein
LTLICLPIDSLTLHLATINCSTSVNWVSNVAASASQTDGLITFAMLLAPAFSPCSTGAGGLSAKNAGE